MNHHAFDQSYFGSLARRVHTRLRERFKIRDTSLSMHRVNAQPNDVDHKAEEALKQVNIFLVYLKLQLYSIIYDILQLCI